MPFVKGKSGNPKGRPVKDNELELLCRQNSAAATKVILDLMRSSDDEGVQLRAAQYIHDRAWGKCRQAVELGGPNGEDLQVNLTINLKGTD